MGQYAVGQSNWMILQNLKEEANNELYFWHSDKQWTLLSLQYLKENVKDETDFYL